MLGLFHKTTLSTDKAGFCLEPWQTDSPCPHSGLWWLLSSAPEVKLGADCADGHTMQPLGLALLPGPQQKSATVLQCLLCCLKVVWPSAGRCMAFTDRQLRNQVLKISFSEFTEMRPMLTCTQQGKLQLPTYSGLASNLSRKGLWSEGNV